MSLTWLVFCCFWRLRFQGKGHSNNVPPKSPRSSRDARFCVFFSRLLGVLSDRQTPHRMVNIFCLTFKFKYSDRLVSDSAVLYKSNFVFDARPLFSIVKCLNTTECKFTSSMLKVILEYIVVVFSNDLIPADWWSHFNLIHVSYLVLSLKKRESQFCIL